MQVGAQTFYVLRMMEACGSLGTAELEPFLNCQSIRTLKIALKIYL